jgi:dipeptidyl aminopeptidase/acylaminoacyl peptidase
MARVRPTFWRKQIDKLVQSENIPVVFKQYLNFGTDGGETGYGFRDNAGTIQFKNSSGVWADLGSGGGGGVTDGDKGDITVSGSGTVWTIDNQAVTRQKMEHIQSQHFLGRHAGSTGDVQEVSPTQARTMLGLATVATSGDYNDLSNLPDLSVFDEVEQYANLAAFPATGDITKFYLAQDTGIMYRWTGSGYDVISASLALGETSSTAYRGDRGKEAYDHSQIVTGNPHGTVAGDISDFNEAAQDAVGTILQNTDDAAWTYDDAAQNISFVTPPAHIGNRTANPTLDGTEEILILDNSNGELRKVTSQGIADLAPGGSGITRSINNVTTSTTAGSSTNTDYEYNCTGTLVITLPTAVGNTNLYTVKRVSGSVSIACTGAETIEGSSTADLTIDGMSLTVSSDGANWTIK